MVKNLIVDVLPGLSRNQIISYLGDPDTSADNVLGYYIGIERIFIYDRRGIEFSPNPEYLCIFLDENDWYSGWHIDGSGRWLKLIGRENYVPLKINRL